MPSRQKGGPWRWSAVVLLALAVTGITGLRAASLEDDVGRSETRVRSAPFPVMPGRTVEELGLEERLRQLGYERVRQRPERAGTYFWGHEVFWIYRHRHRVAGKVYPERLLGLKLRRRDGMVLGPEGEQEWSPRRGREALLWLEPATLSESLSADRAPVDRIRLHELPEQVWRPVLAAEDARFFDHPGVDARALARAALANLKAGEVEQGGSTITQQLVKNRDLTPRQSLGRKASEAARALALEASYTKEEILQAYLNQIYLGQVEGLAVHGLGTAARVYFSKPAADLALAQAALLAGMIQGPNRLSPVRHGDRARERRDWVLGRMLELGWAGEAQVEAARRAGLGLRPGSPERPPAREFLSWARAEVSERHPSWLEKDRGFVVETTLDPHLQGLAEEEVKPHLEALRRSYPRLRGAGLSAALVALDARTAEVLAYVGGDPADAGDRFDRVRLALRQPGSSIKPLLLLEPFDRCGDRKPLFPAARVADEPLTLDLPSGAWEPENFDGRFHGIVDVRSALRHSYNVPFVRISVWCGPEPVAGRMSATGLPIPESPPPSFALGALEATPLDMAGAFTVFATLGRAGRPLAIRRVERPSGRRLSREQPKHRRVAKPATAYLIRDLMRDAVENGTGRAGRLERFETAGKTGTSSSRRDAWFVGHAEGVVTAVWIGLDGGGRLGLTGGEAAAPLWRRFMSVAVPARPSFQVEMPSDIVIRRIDSRTGLLVSSRSRRGEDELFRRGALPPRRRFWKSNRPDPVVR
jgi:penicillin-binding protein 1B